MSGPAPAAPRPAVAPARLIATLGGAGALAGMLIVLVFRWTAPTIAANKAAVLRAAVREVLQEPARFDTLFLVDDVLVETPPAGTDPRTLEQVYPGYREDGTLVGYAIPAGKPGFQDMVRLIFGYDPSTGGLLGMKVLESRETPGLGDKIEKDTTFVGQFRRAVAPLVGVKARKGSGVPEEVDLITGATISSRTVVEAINAAVTRWEPLLTGRSRS